MKTIKHSSTAIAFLILLFAACNSENNRADFIQTANIFSDNMVFQREKPIAVWGKASPNSNFKIRFKEQEITVNTNIDSSWKVNLKPEKAGGPFMLKIMGKDTISFNNVMVGEVWICSGQSNMEMPLAGWGEINNYKEEITNANYPSIRLLTVEGKTSLIPLEQAQLSPWEECSPATVAEFSATAYFFGRKLFQELNVPIGLIHSSVGGTPVEAWTPTEFIREAKDIKPIIPYDERTTGNVRMVETAYNTKTKEWHESLLIKIDETEKGLPDYTKAKFDDSAWDVMNLPQPWEAVENGLGYVDGVVWFRKTFRLKAKDLKNGDFEISLGYIHDKNSTFINGTFIGESKTQWGSEITKYKIPKGILKAGKNTIAIQITNYEWIGGIARDKESLWIKSNAGVKLDLTGQWKYKMIFNLDDFPDFPVSPSNSDEPAVLYNAMINPLIPYTVRGAIWYQGENNAGRPVQYRELFPLLIDAWREKWKDNDFPFYFVQLANYKQRDTEPQPSNWAALREAQSMVLSLPNTGMAVAIDIGDADDIHPKNKQEVGRRLALNALNLTFGKDVVYSGPVYSSMEIIGDTIKLKFTQTGSGLIAKDSDKLKSFSIAGDDRNFVWAETKIEGNSILVWSSKVSNPKSIRFGWANNPECNLYNKEGLPASPFRTDNWDLIIDYGNAY